MLNLSPTIPPSMLPRPRVSLLQFPLPLLIQRLPKIQQLTASIVHPGPGWLARIDPISSLVVAMSHERSSCLIQSHDQIPELRMFSGKVRDLHRLDVRGRDVGLSSGFLSVGGLGEGGGGRSGACLDFTLTTALLMLCPFFAGQHIRGIWHRILAVCLDRH